MKLGNFLGVLMIIGVVLLAFYGWVCNIIAILNMGVFELTGELVIRVVGVFVFPVGCIVGYY